TNSTLAGALVASKLHIPVIHVEAGLRSYNKRMPEEVNRIMTDHVSTLLFAPTDQAVINLEEERIDEGVYQVGDVMYDVVLFRIGLAEEKCSLHGFLVHTEGYLLGTTHRAENTDDPRRFESILRAFADVEEKVLLPLHPRTKGKIERFGFQ